MRRVPPFGRLKALLPAKRPNRCLLAGLALTGSLGQRWLSHHLILTDLARLRHVHSSYESSIQIVPECFGVVNQSLDLHRWESIGV